MKSDSYDDLDRQLVHALQVDARAAFSRIAAVLGVSDKTVARRYARLRSSGAVRVVGLADPYLGGGMPWLVRVRCAPAAAGEVARALARRVDTAWVRLTSGGTEIVCALRGGADRDGEALLLEHLPRTPRIEQVNAHCLLHVFYGGPLSLIAKQGALTPDQVRRLQPEPTAGRDTPLSDEDRRLVEALGRDARAGFGELCRVTGWSPSTVRRRLAELRGGGALYFDVDFDTRMFPGRAVWTMLWLTVDPRSLDAAGKALAGHPEVAFAAATTGATNLHASVACASVPALYEYLTHRVSTLNGVRAIETAPVLRGVKHAGPLLSGR
ncbi:Lrp/AsnC family transcriptional regulator [Pseudonocardia acaciae]|uniref:Lrp/AsnC family transcriptional regulator n=1 Tax=Pseudonocardia acaciae TaxID=551276 RepID=UPI00048C4EE4|nr:Lrp/AsnC family transcriptional regulator [Pseudonocardia acaciae]